MVVTDSLYVQLLKCLNSLLGNNVCYNLLRIKCKSVKKGLAINFLSLYFTRKLIMIIQIDYIYTNDIFNSNENIYIYMYNPFFRAD